MAPASHYDNRTWRMGEAEFARNVERLRRLGKTLQYVCGEHHLAEKHNDKRLLALVQSTRFESIEAATRVLNLQSILEQEGIQDFITSNHPEGNFTFDTFPWVNHNGEWTLCDTPTRKKLRNWVHELVSTVDPFKD